MIAPIVCEPPPVKLGRASNARRAAWRTRRPRVASRGRGAGARPRGPMNDAPRRETAGDLQRVMGFWSGLALIVGITIGSGVFRKPYTLARDVGDAPLILGLWAGFGLVALCGALAVAELSSMLPRTGGAYVFLRAAYGDAAAFVFGWLYLLVATPAAVGALATFFAELLLELSGRDPARVPAWTVPALAGITILALSAVNVRGARPGAAVQALFTVV